MAISFQYNHHNMLNRWATRMRENPWRFNQFEDPFAGTTRPTQRTTKSVFFQKHREELAQALESAFDLVTYYLGYYPKPTFTEDIVLSLNPKYSWWDQTLTIPVRHLIQFGKAKYKTPTIGHTYVPITLALDQLETTTVFIPGYKVTLTLPSDEDRNILSLQNKYRFFISPPTTTMIDTAMQDNMLLTQTYGEITENNGTYTYSFIIPAWEQVNYQGRWNDL